MIFARWIPPGSHRPRLAREKSSAYSFPSSPLCWRSLVVRRANFKERTFGQRTKGASVSRKWMVIIAVLVVDLIIAIAVVAIVLDRERDDARRAATVATSTTGLTSPYDFTELPDDVDLDVIEDASFVSILVPNESGELTSYGVSMELPAAQSLSAAVRDAEEVEAGTAATILGAGSTGAGAAGAAITFVLPGRETLTFVVDLDQGLITRAGRAWRVDGDLGALVEAAAASPG